MDTNLILSRLDRIESLLEELAILKKDVLNVEEACRHLTLSRSHLYKLTSSKKIPHFCPVGRRIYFNRVELDKWMQRHRQSSKEEVEQAAIEYVMANRNSFMRSG
jgi:excisionase family DNA binding protein